MIKYQYITVVIAIIAILASMLLPALNKARSKALGIHCMNTIRTLALAMTEYVETYDDYCLPTKTTNNVFPQYGSDQSWYQLLMKAGLWSYYNNKNQCPADHKQSVDYGVNSLYFWVNRFITHSKVKRPDILIWGGEWLSSTTYGINVSSNTTAKPAFRHANTINLFFMDAHAENWSYSKYPYDNTHANFKSLYP
jgi:type II secretory pathway pseudopilin PulG